MCYRSDVPELDLEGLHVACLCGDNGHGKTALFDAMTWALWGKSRASTQDELVHQGEQDMAVELEFKARDQRYRVSRRHSRAARSRQGSTLLELQVSSGNGYQAITGNSIRETEAQIRDLLHLDYDTFVNTAFLVQGHADMFTSNTPAKRKETLAEVLDLAYYDRLEERSKVRSRGKQDELRDAEAAIAMRQTEIGQAAELRQQQEVVKATLDRVAPEVERQRATVDELQASVGSLAAGRSEMESVERHLSSCRSEAQELARQVEMHRSRIAEYEASVARESEISRRHSELETSRAELERMNEAVRQKGELDGEKARLEREIAVQKERLSGQAERLRTTVEQDLKPRIDRIPELEERRKETDIEQSELDILVEELEKGRGDLPLQSARAAYLRESNEALRQSMEETRRKFDLLTDDQAECPLCKQPLGPDGREHLTREYAAQGQQDKQKFQANNTELQGNELAQFELTARISNQENELSSRTQRLQVEFATLDRDMDESQRAKVEIGASQNELKALEKRIVEGRFAEREKAEVVEVEVKLSSLDYDDTAYRKIQERVMALEPYADLQRSLTEAQRSLPEEQEALATTDQLLQRRNQESVEDEERLGALQRELQALPGLEDELARATSALQNVQKKRDEALVEQGVLKDQLDRLARLEAEVRIKEESRRRLGAEKTVYDELAAAFGKNGIQALIIETAIPQLENDANELLGRLTENRMFLKLELQQGRRDSKTGLPSESLQVLISDEVGTRSYETFSGGEAFRIDFALRIALSKLLARRSGAPLPILFIDEGFGTQDVYGQERLKEAIQSIQDDFEKIIVITHIEQIKESFPVRIEVSKTEGASTFVVV